MGYYFWPGAAGKRLVIVALVVSMASIAGVGGLVLLSD